MRSLAEHQWQRYFDLVERLGPLAPAQRRAALNDTAADPDVVALAALHLHAKRDFDRCRSGETVGNCVLAERIGRGGMGVVYRARQTFADGIERTVAIKLIDPALLVNESAAAHQRFRHEIAALARLEHKGIARLYDGGVHRCPDHGEHTPYFAMELVHGQALDEHVAAHRAELGTIGVLQLFLRVCDAVAHAHRQGIVHRDLKPANVLVDDAGDPRVIDFGLAAPPARAALERVASAAGTPAYMSPEQAEGAPAAPAMDVFALGVMLRELLVAMGHAHQVHQLQQALARVVAKATAQRPALRYRSVPALMKAVEGCMGALAQQQHAANGTREELLRKVQTFWIDGILSRSRHGLPPLDLGLAVDTAAVERAWQSVVGADPAATQSLPRSTAITELFEASGHSLLLLGAPGGGKTTLLLMLGKALLAAARRDACRRVPVVFHLATWAEQRLPLADWLVGELDKRYDVPPRIARDLLAGGGLVLLLDGLDEVESAQRAACVAAINAFQRDCRGAQLVVCCRQADYETLPMRLRLQRAVTLLPLALGQVQRVLDRAGPALAGLRAALAGDASLRELLTTPLMLSIAASAYRDRAAVAAAGSADEQRRLLFAAYTQAMFTRRCPATAYDEAQAARWLGWLADALRRHHQGVFYLEAMQPDWLERRLERWAVGPGSIVLCGLLVGLVVGIGSSAGAKAWYALPISLLLGLAGGLTFGLQGWGDRIQPIVGLRWSWSSLRDALRAKLALAAGAGLMLGAGVALVFDLAAGVALGVMMVLGFAYFSGLDRDALQRDPAQFSAPNHGIRQSLRNAWRGSVIGAIAGAVAGAIAGGVGSALFCAAVFGLAISMIAGSQACLQHLTLRALLWRRGHAPWRYLHFLEFAVERGFLQRVGGGFVFVHRALLEHFADLHAAISTDNARR